MKSHIEINAENLRHNLNEFIKLTGKKLIFVVKANAYGHGLEEIIKILLDFEGILYYAVDSAAEALIIRKIDKKKNILVIGWEDEQELRELIKNGFELVVSSLDYMEKTSRISEELKTRARVHLKIETGTTRLGMVKQDIIKIMKKINSLQVDIKGVYSHFANIEDTISHTYATKQLDIFAEILPLLKDKTILKHFSCSASALLFPQTYMDGVRVGISAYGLWPSRQTYLSYYEKNGKILDLRPVLCWKSRVGQVKHLVKGEYIGYGLTYQTFSDAKIAVIPVGYYDGYDRRLSNIATVIIKGTKAPVRGRVCMNMIMAEVTHIKNIREGDEVILLGKSGEAEVSADYLADLCGTINYEIVSRLSPMLPRVICQ